MVNGDYKRHVQTIGTIQGTGFALECMLTTYIDGDESLPDLIACLAREQLALIAEVRSFAVDDLQQELMLITARACGASLMLNRWLSPCSDMPQDQFNELPEATLKLIKNNNLSITSLLIKLENM